MRTLPFVLAGLLFASGLARDTVDLWVEQTDLPPLGIEVGVEVTARDGTLLRAFTVADGRWRLEPGAVDAEFVAMLVAYEDKRFWRHAGVDPVALLRSAWLTVAKGRAVSGGSTLTMQVARLLEDSGTGRLSGKLRQMRVALALERHLSKDEILSLYLRLAPYGGNLEGIRAATLAWFGKAPRRLTPAESALLVALPQSPETRRPDRAPARAVDARARVLSRLVTAGVLTEDRARAALREPVPGARRPFPAHAPHLADRLRRENPSLNRIATTISPKLQKSLEALAARAVHDAPQRASLAMIVADHRTGEILASVGSPDWTDSARAGFIDMTRAPRSPGSTLKPLVYALAFDDGLAHPETLIEDRPMVFGSYAPQNFDRTFRGTVSVREALQLSLNIPVVSLTQAIGPSRLLSALRKAGADPLLPGAEPGLAVALGGLGVTLEDLVHAYAALARLGAPVRLATRSLDASRTLDQRLFSPEAAWMVNDILAGLAPPANAPAHRIAYKTGTSYGHRDAWALGFDGGHVAGVWMGRPDGASIPGAFGGDLAAPILFDAFARIGPEPVPLPPPPPATLLLSNARLPLPLQRFRPRGTEVLSGAGPEIAFPPDGAEVEPGPMLAMKVRGGTPPFTWLANGAPVVLADRAREAALPAPGPGYLTLLVIDANGKSASAQVTLRP